MSTEPTDEETVQIKLATLRTWQQRAFGAEDKLRALEAGRASAVTLEEIATMREAEKMLIQWAPFGGLGMATELRALVDRLEKGTGR